jgi:hypothetical protein
MSSAQDRPPTGGPEDSGGYGAGATQQAAQQAGARTGTQQAEPQRGAGRTSTGQASTGQASTGRADMGRTEASRAEYAAGHRAGGGMAAMTGGTVLAGTLMILAGLWGFLEGLVAIMHQSFFVSQAGYTYQFNVHGWGWLHLALGIVLFAAGVCVLLGQTWAKAVGIVLAVFSGIANFLFLPYYPLWSIIVIALDVFVIWALMTPRRQRA